MRLTLGGVGGAFGAREDISLQVHACLLALRTGRPVRMQYSRDESFLGHVHRHPADDLDAPPRRPPTGEIVKIEARMVLDGGAYASTSSAVLINAVTHAQGPYRCANAVVDGYAVRTNNLPCGAMRGFGVVQACFAHERQMDKLAAACGLDPVEIRLRNAMETGDRLITGQVVENVAPVARCIRETAALPLPTEPVGGHDRHRCGCPVAPAAPPTPRTCPGHRLGRGDQEPHVLRGLRRLLDGSLPAGRWRGHAEVRHGRGRPGLRHDRPADRPQHPRRGRGGAGADGHGGGLGRFDVGVPPDVDVGGCSRPACRAVREQLFEHVAARHGLDPLRLAIEDDCVVDTFGDLRVPVVEATAGQVVRGDT